jgi:hypothetical protein
MGLKGYPPLKILAAQPAKILNTVLAKIWGKIAKFGGKTAKF